MAPAQTTLRRPRMLSSRRLVAIRLMCMLALASCTLGHSAVAQVLFQESFDTDQSANWQYNSFGPGNSADFFFDYSTVGVPAAPGSVTTRGLRLEANVGADTFGGGSASPLGLVLPSEYVLTAYVWQNSVGPFPGGGSGSTHLTSLSVGVSGTASEFQGGTMTGVQFSATGDGGSASDWRAYNGSGSPLSTAITPSVYAAGSLNASNPYYQAVFAGQAPPVDQLMLFPEQTGTTAPGTPAFGWNLWEITKTTSSIDWRINGVDFATVDASLFPLVFGGDNFAFGHADINDLSSTSTSPLIFSLVDNITVTAVPEPSTVTVVGVVCTGLVCSAMRRRRRPDGTSVRSAVLERT